VTNLSSDDQKYIWHPFTQMQTAEAPIPVIRGEGVYLYTEDGKKILDAISSWWVSIHGHAHPYIIEKVTKQLQSLEHVMFAGFTHSGAVQLAKRLIHLLPNKIERIFYSDNGSTAVEVALKMAFQFSEVLCFSF